MQHGWSFVRGEEPSSCRSFRSKFSQISEVDLRSVVNNAFVIQHAALAGFDPCRIGSTGWQYPAKCLLFVRFAQRDVAEKHKCPLAFGTATVPKIGSVVKILGALETRVEAVAEHSSDLIVKTFKRDELWECILG